MPIPFALIDLSSVSWYATNVSDIYTSSKDPTKTPVISWFTLGRKLLVLFVSRHRSDHLLRQ